MKKSLGTLLAGVVAVSGCDSASNTFQSSERKQTETAADPRVQERVAQLQSEVDRLLEDQRFVTAEQVPEKKQESPEQRSTGTETEAEAREDRQEPKKDEGEQQQSAEKVEQKETAEQYLARVHRAILETRLHGEKLRQHLWEETLGSYGTPRYEVYTPEEFEAIKNFLVQHGQYIGKQLIQNAHIAFSGERKLEQPLRSLGTAAESVPTVHFLHDRKAIEVKMNAHCAGGVAEKAHGMTFSFSITKREGVKDFGVEGTELTADQREAATRSLGNLFNYFHFRSALALPFEKVEEQAKISAGIKTPETEKQPPLAEQKQ